ncbi:MATE family efflux transporter [Facklamia sp. 7083-14-GEN3]|uniref:MATE family efflux transporter n=1 Tax=Facklamia sp. 7083-14-GEN3 TaxID=2973478 RepID=UPI00215C9CAD|nr:MATE family efflux transporter [Facklamia sp. 7083-14-GEN3]MCR8968537.1 MATE family efflux transporter [Facklamia sp. 7083-14-GEN3]
MTTGSPIKKIIRFSIPLIIGNLFQLFYNMVDTFIVGRSIGLNALAGVGLAGSLGFLILGFAQGFTTGTSIPLAQAFGAKDFKRVKRSVAINITLALAVTVVLTILSILYLKDILNLMRTPDAIITYAYDYMIIIFSGMIVTVLYNMVSNILRAIGDSRTPVVALVITTIANILFDILFIVYFKLGVAGAAYATILSQLIAVLICYYVIHKDIYFLQVSRRDFQLNGKEVIHHCLLGFPMAFQTSIIAIGAISVSTALNTLGPEAVGGYAAASKIDQLVIQVLMSFGIAMSTYSAQNYGAGQYSRINLGVKQGILLSFGVSFVFAVLLIFTGGYFTSLFGDQSAGLTLHQYGQEFFLLTAPFYWLLALLFILRSTLQGLNESFIPTVAGIAELIMRVIAAFVLTPIIGFSGTVLSNPMAWLGSLVILIPAFYRKHHELKLLKDL